MRLFSERQDAVEIIIIIIIISSSSSSSTFTVEILWLVLNDLCAE